MPSTADQDKKQKNKIWNYIKNNLERVVMYIALGCVIIVVLCAAILWLWWCAKTEPDDNVREWSSQNGRRWSTQRGNYNKVDTSD